MDIVRALETGRPDEAQQAMDDHLAYVLQYSIDIPGGTTA
jgi:DNA-binding FadR family transcriptional regulator